MKLRKLSIATIAAILFAGATIAVSTTHVAACGGTATPVSYYNYGGSPHSGQWATAQLGASWCPADINGQAVEEVTYFLYVYSNEQFAGVFADVDVWVCGGYLGGFQFESAITPTTSFVLQTGTVPYPMGCGLQADDFSRQLNSISYIADQDGTLIPDTYESLNVCPWCA